jgi:tetratricopeptide (TPR) repeat protein
MAFPRGRSFMLFLVIPMLFANGCATTRTRLMVDSMNPLMAKMRDATNRNTDFELVKDAMPSLLVQMDGFIAASPENTYLLASAAEAYMGYAFLFVEDTDKKRAKGLYLKAKEYALRSLKLNKTFAEAFAQDDLDVFKHSLQTIEKEDIASLYFAINAWLQWVGASADDASVLNDLPRIEAMIDRALELDDSFYHGGIHATLGAFYVASPEMFGGKPDQADFQFKEAFEISQSKYLMWHYLYARYYAFAINDRALFVATLEKVISAPDDILPEETFVTMAVKAKAKNLLTHTDDYFLAK